MLNQSSQPVIVLAAGLGKRMHSAIPKVLHEIGEKPLLFHVLSQIQSAIPQASIGLVVGYKQENIKSYVANDPVLNAMNIQWVIQDQPRGTGDAVRCAMRSSWGQSCIQYGLPILVLPGDLPLIPVELIRQMMIPLESSSCMRLLTCSFVDPRGYGRVIRDSNTRAILRIIEEKDATDIQKAVPEVAASIYLFKPHFLQEAVSQLSNHNAQGEYYLTDVVQIAYQKRQSIESCLWQREEDLRGVNDLWELSQADDTLNRRCIQHWAKKGVRFFSPQTTRIASTVELAEGVSIGAGVILSGKTKIGRGSILGPHVVLKDTEVGEGANIKTGTISDSAQIGEYSQVGPYAHLRPGSCLGSYVKVGNFVELKKTWIGNHTSIAHLSYLGDAQVGERVNIGCGFVTCNFDGTPGSPKHQTIIDDDVFLGSDCQVVAPIRIGRGAYVASGSTLTENVEPNALAIARSRQMIKKGYALKLRSLKKE